MIMTYIYVACPNCGETYSYPNRGYRYNCPYCHKNYEECNSDYWEANIMNKYMLFLQGRKNAQRQDSERNKKEIVNENKISDRVFKEYNISSK